MPAVLCNSGPTTQGAGGRLAGSDFAIPGGSTSNVDVALTALGRQLASTPHGFDATVLVDMLNYGIVLNTTDSSVGSFTVTSTDAESFPPGAAVNCGGAIFAGSTTSCPFAKNVRRVYVERVGNGAAIITAYSPVTGRTYAMHCMGVSPHRCKGGVNALVEFYS